MKATTVEAYIASAPAQAQPMLREIRRLLKTVAPKAKDVIKWGYPALEADRILFSYSAHKDHLNFMPTRTTIEPMKAKLKGYTFTQDTLQLPYDRPLPVELIKEIADYRVKEVSQGSLWKHHDNE